MTYKNDISRALELHVYSFFFFPGSSAKNYKLKAVWAQQIWSSEPCWGVCVHEEWLSPLF